MQWLVLIVVILVLVAFFLRRQAGGAAIDGGERLPYTLSDSLFSPAERSFLGVLDQAVGGDFRVMGKVRVADVLGVAKGIPKSSWQHAFNRINAKHFDYLLCRPGDLKPVCAIELNDQSHQRSDRRGRDQFLEKACAAAHLPLIFLPAQRAYTPAEVCREVAAATGVCLVPPASRTLHLVTASAAEVSLGEDNGEVSAPPCPRCASPMVKRVAQSGENAGKAFWGCTRFPSCRGTVFL